MKQIAPRGYAVFAGKGSTYINFVMGNRYVRTVMSKHRNAIAAKNKGNTGKWKQFASAASIAVEKWAEVAENPEVKTELEVVLDKLSAL